MRKHTLRILHVIQTQLSSLTYMGFQGKDSLIMRDIATVSVREAIPTANRHD